MTKIRLIAGLLAALTAWAESGQRAGESRKFDGMEFVWVPSGEFPMGSTSAEARGNEQPVMQVRISRGYWLGRYEVTQAVMGPIHLGSTSAVPIAWWRESPGMTRRRLLTS